MNRRSFLQKIAIGGAAFAAAVALYQRVDAEHFGPQLHSLQSTPVTAGVGTTDPGIIQGEKPTPKEEMYRLMAAHLDSDPPVVKVISTPKGPNAFYEVHQYQKDFWDKGGHRFGLFDKDRVASDTFRTKNGYQYTQWAEEQDDGTYVRKWKLEK